MTLRCILDGILLDAELQIDSSQLIVWDGNEPFVLEAVEALFYEIVAASREELLGLERARYRLLFWAAEFEFVESKYALLV